MDVGETAMVVGEDKAVGRYNFTRTSVAEDTDNIFQARACLTLELGGR